MILLFVVADWYTESKTIFVRELDAYFFSFDIPHKSFVSSSVLSGWCQGTRRIMEIFVITLFKNSN